MMTVAIPRTARLLAALGVAALLSLALALPALAHGDHGHSHSHSHGLSHERDPDNRVKIDWDGTATEDCRATGEGTILWTLTGSAAVTYAELHIDEPVFSVTVREGGPYLWISPLYPLDEIEADVDWVDGPLADGARLTATTCPEGGAGGDGWLIGAAVVGVALAGGALGLLVGSRRRKA